MVREATHDDISELMRMGRAFHAVAGVADLIPLDEASLARTFASLIDSEGATVLVIDGEEGLTGATGALLHPHYFNASHLTGQELFWWIDPEHRGHGTALLDALEQWVRSQNADTFSMIALESLEPEKVGAIYRRRGYRSTERSYLRGF